MPSILRVAAVAVTATALTAIGLGVPAVALGAEKISSVSPAYGPIGSTLEIQGSGLTGATFTIHSVQLPYAAGSTPSDTAVDVTVPNGVTTGHVVGHEGSDSFTGPVFTVQQATKATERLSRHTATYHHKVTVTGTLTVAATGAAVKQQRATLQRRFAGSSTWRRFKGASAGRTSKHGTVSWTVTPIQNVAFRVSFAASPSRTAATTAPQTLGIRPALHVSLPHTTQTRSATSLTGQVRPRLVGPVVVQRRLHGKWHTIAHPATKHGDFSVAVTPGGVGSYRYRVIRRADARHRAATSRVLTTRVIARTLQIGDSGKDVAALQKQLRHLHYDVGSPSSVYGDDLLHAVTAFEKVQGMHRDGVAGQQVQVRLDHNPRVPHLRHPLRHAAVSVEVNLSKEILLIAKHGHIWRILDTSTGGGYYFTDSNGNSERAITPSGHFAIRYKENGTVHARLGTLYRPSYFNYDGYAIHGEGNGNDGGEVPPYPNSHGCVRITNNAVDRYYYLLAVGVSVWIYG